MKGWTSVCPFITLGMSATPDAKSIAQKSGDVRRGKSLPAPPDRGAKISAAKKGVKLTDAHKLALKAARVGLKLLSPLTILPSAKAMYTTPRGSIGNQNTLWVNFSVQYRELWRIHYEAPNH